MMTDHTERRRRLTHAACTPSANNQRTTRLPPHPGFFSWSNPACDDGLFLYRTTVSRGVDTQRRRRSHPGFFSCRYHS